MSESSIERRCMTLARSRGYRLIKLVPVVKGMPDRLLTHPRPDLVFIEFKKPGGVVSEIQQHRIEELQTAGYLIRVIDSVDGFQDLLDSLDKRRYPNVSTPGD